MPLRLFGNGGKPGSDMLMLEEENENNDEHFANGF